MNKRPDAPTGLPAMRIETAHLPEFGMDVS